MKRPRPGEMADLLEHFEAATDALVDAVREAKGVTDDDVLDVERVEARPTHRWRSESDEYEVLA